MGECGEEGARAAARGQRAGLAECSSTAPHRRLNLGAQHLELLARLHLGLVPLDGGVALGAHPLDLRSEIAHLGCMRGLGTRQLFRCMLSDRLELRLQPLRGACE